MKVYRSYIRCAYLFVYIHIYVQYVIKYIYSIGGWYTLKFYKVYGKR